MGKILMSACLLGLKVMTNTGLDVTEEYQESAELALELCKKNKIKFALLKARSPSANNLL